MSSWSHVPARTRARIRAALAATLPAPCPRCGLPVYPDRFDVDHIDPCVLYPDAVLDTSRMAAAHPGCNRAAGAGPLRARGFTAPFLR